jgi:DNA-binding XRE family transcriptional regulator
MVSDSPEFGFFVLHLIHRPIECSLWIVDFKRKSGSLLSVYAIDDYIKGNDNERMLRKSRECVRFGKRVKTLRTKAGLSQERLGFRAGVHPVSISRIETASLNATVTMIHKLAKALRVHPSKLFTN